MIKIGEIRPKGISALKVYYDEKAKTNPYGVYHEWFEPGPYGLRKRKKLVVRYSDLLSCLMVLVRYVEAHNEEGR